MRKWLPLALIAGMSALSVVAFTRLPALVVVPLSGLLPFIPAGASETLPRAVAAFGLPGLALLVWALLHEAPTRPLGRWTEARLRARASVDGPTDVPTGAASYERYASTYRLIVLWVVALVLAAHAELLAHALEWSVTPGRVFGLTFAAGLIGVGNLLPRLRPNGMAGIRTARTLADPVFWRRVHRRYGALWMFFGTFVLLTALVAPTYALGAGLLALIASSVALLVGDRFLVVFGLVVSLVFVASNTALAAAASSELALEAGSRAVRVATHADVAADTLPPASVTESVIPMEANGLAIHAVLTMPAARAPGAPPLPVALIVAGSGPSDHQGNSLGTPVRPFVYARLAWGLAERGIASVRYDKRGIGRSTIPAGDLATLTLGRYRDDVVELARRLRTDARFSRLVLVGHSEGAGLVLEAANAGAPIDGFVMLSGAGRPLAQVLAHQFRLQFDSATSARLDASFEAYLQGADPTDVPASIKPLFLPHNRSMLRSMAAYDPAAEMRRSRLPAFVVHGRMDLQVIDADFDALVAARPSVDRLAIPAANHVFKATSARTLAEQLPVYMDPSLELVPELVPEVAEWILRLERGVHGGHSESQRR